MSTLARLILLGALTLALLIIAVCVGPTSLLNFSSLWHLLREGASTPELQRASLVLWELRLPRVFLAAGVGANLALGGLLLQAIFRNPLAEPYLLGLSSGGALAAVLALAAGMTSVTWPALGGSLAVALLVLLLCRHRVASDLPSLLLAGVALGALAQAFTTATILRFNPEALRGILFWLMGSFANQGWSAVALVLPTAVIGFIFTLFLHRPLDLLAIGGESAHHLGVPTHAVQIMGIALAAALAAVTVAVCGTIGFVGLMAPHLARRVAGAPHAVSVPASLLLGVMLTVGSDLVARTLLVGTELPVGVVTGALGCMFFLALLRQKR